jgi:hypothetical protein
MPGKRNAPGDRESVWLLVASALCIDDDVEEDDEEGDVGTENPSTETTAEQAKTAANTWTGIAILMVQQRLRNEWFSVRMNAKRATLTCRCDELSESPEVWRFPPHVFAASILYSRVIPVFMRRPDIASKLYSQNSGGNVTFINQHFPEITPSKTPIG